VRMQDGEIVGEDHMDHAARASDAAPADVEKPAMATPGNT
jgi:hypothetical protein